MFVFLLFRFLILSLGSPAGVVDSFPPVIGKVKGALAAKDPSQQKDLEEILDRVSAALLWKPYTLGPLGEGPGSENPKPLYRLDAFDCTTYIETVMANAYCFRSGTNRSACLSDTMRQIRYLQGQVDFQSRKHIPELDWLPGNVSQGYLEDLSATLFPGEWKEAEVTIDRELWISAHSKLPKQVKKGVSLSKKGSKLFYLPVSLFFTKANISPEAMAALTEKLSTAQKEIAARSEGKELNVEQKEDAAKDKFRAEMEYLRVVYLPIEQRLRMIPTGTVLNLVHSAVKDPLKAKMATIVSHQGLIIQKPDGPHLRHAALNVGHVSDQRLDSYLLRYVRSANARGISLFKVLPPKK